MRVRLVGRVQVWAREKAGAGEGVQPVQGAGQEGLAPVGGAWRDSRQERL